MARSTKKTATQQKAVPAVKLEALEQRILLSGDTPLAVGLTDPSQNPIQVVVVESSTGMETTSSGGIVPFVAEGGTARTPLEKVSPTGNVQVLSADALTASQVGILAGETLEGSGELAGALVNSGTVAPGHSPGIVTVSSYSQASTASLKIEIGGTTAGGTASNPLDGYDRLAVQNQAALDGTLAVSLINDFHPVAGQVYDVMTWATRQGNFANYTGLYAGQGIWLKPVYQSDRLQLVATALPGLAELSSVGGAAALEKLDQFFTWAADATSGTHSLTLDAAIDLAGMRLSGTWSLSVTAGLTPTLGLALADGSLAWGVGDLSGSLSGVSGSLSLLGSQLTSGSFSGAGRVVAGSAAAMSGNFSVSWSNTASLWLVSGNAISARLGDQSTGPSLSLSNGYLGLALSSTGYAVDAGGDGRLQGIGIAAFSGSLGFRANTLGQALTLDIGSGASLRHLAFTTAETFQRFEARNADLTVTGLGSLHGDLAFLSRSETVGGKDLSDMLVGITNGSGTVSAGELALTLSNGTAALLLRSATPMAGGAGVELYALRAVADASISLGNAVTLTGDGVTVEISSAADAVSLSVPSVAGAIPLELAANAARASGNFSVTVGSLMAFSGELTVDGARAVRMLSSGKAVTVQEFTIHGSNVLASLTPAGSSMGATLSRTAFALIYDKEVGGDGRAWVSAKAAPGALSVAGLELSGVDNALVSINKEVAGSDGTVISWQDVKSLTLADGRNLVLDQLSEIVELPVQASLKVGQNQVSGTLDFTAANGGWDITVSDAQLIFAAGPAFVRLTGASGSLRVNSDRSRSGSLSGAFSLGGVAGLSLSGTGSASFGADGEFAVSGSASLAIEGFGSLSGSVSVARQETSNGPVILVGATGVNGDFGAAGSRVSVSSASLGLILGTNAVGQGGYALKATGSAALSGFDGTATLSADATVSINHMGTAVSQAIAQGGSNSMTLSFADEREIQAVTITSGTLTIAGVGSLTGSLAIVASQSTVAGATVSDVVIGLEGVSANLALGSASASLTGGRGAVVLRKDASGIHYAIQAEGSASLTGVSGVSLSATNMQVAINQMGAAVDTTVATATGWYGMSMLSGEMRFRGTVHADIAGLLSVDGDMFIESRPSQTVTLSDADHTQVVVNELLLGGTGLSAAISAGANESVGASLTNASLALVLATESNPAQGQTARRWLTAQAAYGGASVAGYQISQIQSANLLLNRALSSDGSTLGDASAPVVDWSRGSLGIYLDANTPVSMSQATGGFDLNLSAALALGQSSLSGSLDVRLNQAGDGSRSWDIVASGVAVTLTAGAASASIRNGAGTLHIAADGTKSGSISGSGTISGVDGVTASGTLATSFDGQGGLTLAGSLDLGVAGFGSLSGNFSLVREPAQLAVPVEKLNTADTGVSGSSSETQQGGLSANTRLKLSVSAGTLAREGLYAFQWGGQIATASSQDANGKPLTDAAFAANIRMALETLNAIGAGNVTVTGSRADGFSIEFIGALAGKVVALAASQGDEGIWLTEPADAADKTDWGVIEHIASVSLGSNESQQLTLNNAGGSFTLTVAGNTTASIPVLAASSAVNERQVITLVASPLSAGQFWLTVNGQQTRLIRYSADPTYHAAQMQSALEALLGAGNATVSYVSGYTGNNSIDYVVDFKGSLAGKDVGQLGAASNNSAIKLTVKTVRNGSPGYSVQNQASQIQSALQAVLGAGNVSVSWDTTSSLTNARYRIDFAQALGGQNLAQMTVGGSPTGVSATTLADGASGRGAIQNVDLYDENVVGTFQLSLVYRGSTYTSADIAFNASASAVRNALLGAENAAGGSFGATGADASVSLITDGNGHHVWQVIFGGTAIGYDFAVMEGMVTSTVSAPEASLSGVQLGYTRNETQHLTLSGSGLYRLSIGNGTAQSVTLSATSSAADIQAALEGLSEIGSGNVIVTAAQAGGFDIAFQGGLAGTDMGAIKANAVQTVALLLADGRTPENIAVRLGAGQEWSVSLDISGRSQDQIATALGNLISTLPDIGFGQGNVQVTAREGVAWTFDISFQGALTGASPGTVQVLSTRTDVVASERILIGASGVTGTFGSVGSSVSLADGSLGLVLQKNAAGQTGYALVAGGTVSLSGFGDAVSLSASGQVRINSLGEAVNREVLTGLSSNTVAVSFADGIARKELTINSGTVTVSGLGSLSGSLKLVSTYQVVQGTAYTDLAIGLENVTGSLTLGGVGASLTDGAGAIVLRQEVAADGTTTNRYALAADGSVALTGLTGVTLTADKLQIAWNQWGEAVDKTVATASGSYALNLLKDEARLRGQMHAAVAGVLDVSGDMFIQSRTGQALNLTDGTTVQTSQLVFGGAGISASVGATGGPGLALTDTDIAVVIASETGGSRRWLTSRANVGGATVTGFELGAVNSATLDVNGALVSGALQTTGVVAQWSKSPDAIALAPDTSVTLDDAASSVAVTVDGVLKLGPASLSGTFSLTQAADGQTWTVGVSNGAVGVQAGSAYVGVSAASGSLVLGNGTRSGSLTGAAAIQGLGDLSFSGNFSTSFDGSGNLAFAGTGVSLAVAGFGSLTGSFAVNRASDGSILVGATGVSATFGSGNLGVGLSGASLALYVGAKTADSAGYALVASGAASLNGGGAVSMAATAEVRINTLGKAVSQTLTVGGGSVSVSFSDGTAVQELAITNGSVAVSGLGTLTGNLAVRSVTSGNTVDVSIGLADVAGSLTLGGAVSASLSAGTGAVLLHKVGTAAATYAVSAHGSVSVSGADAISLSATDMEVAYNRLGSAVTDRVVSTGLGSYTVNLLDNETRLRGNVSASVAGVLSVSGEMFIESRTAQAATLSDNSSVTVDQLIFGGAGVAASISAGAGASLSNVDIALVLSSEVGGTSRKWLSSKAAVGGAAITGFSLADLQASASLNINCQVGHVADTSVPVIKWGTALAVPLSGTSGSFTLDQTTSVFDLGVDGSLVMGPATLAGNFDVALQSGGAWDVHATDVTVSVAGGGATVALTHGTGDLYLTAGGKTGSIAGSLAVTGVPDIGFSGNFAASFDPSGNFAFSGTGVSLSVAGFASLSGNFAVKKDAGTGRILVGAEGVNGLLGGASAGVALSNGSLGLVMDRNAAGDAAYALEAAGSVVLSGFGGDVSMSATGSVRINNLGAAVSQTLSTGSGSTTVTFADGTALREVTISSATLHVANLGDLSGSMKLTSSSYAVGGIGYTDLSIGLADVNGSLALGGVGATLTNGNGGILLQRKDDHGTVSTRYAVAADGSVSLTGVSGVTLQANNLQVAWNRWGSDLDTSVQTATGTYAIQAADNESRLRGQMHAALSDVLTVDGELFIQSLSNQTVSLTGGGTATVNQLIFGGAGVSAHMGSASVGADITDANIGVIISTATNSDPNAGKQWVSARATLGGATVQGYALAQITDAYVNLNGALSGGAFVTTGALVDWSGAHSKTLTLKTGTDVVLADTGPVLELGATANLQIGPAVLGGTFDIALEQSGANRAWHVLASGVTVGMATNGVWAGLSNGAGDLWFGKDATTGTYGADKRSGSISGTGSVTGVQGLTLTGTVVANFDSLGNFQIAGDIAVDVAGYAGVNGNFAVTKQVAQTVTATVLTSQPTAGDTGTITTSTQGGQTSNTSFHLAAWSGSQFREGSYAFKYGNTTIEVSTLGADGSALSDAGLLARFQSGLQLLLGSGNVQVTGSRAAGFDIELKGVFAGRAVAAGASGLLMTPPADPADGADWGSVYLLNPATATTGAVQLLDPFPTLTQGTFTLDFDFDIKTNSQLKLTAASNGRFREGSYAFSYNGRTAGASSVDASGNPVTDGEFGVRLTRALEILYGTGNVAVTGSRAAGYVFAFGAKLTGQNIALASSASDTTGLWMVAPADPSAGLATSGGTSVESQAVAGSLPSGYDLEIQLPSGATKNSESFTFQFANTSRTVKVKFVNIQTSQPRQIYDALAALIGAPDGTTTINQYGNATVKSSMLTVSALTSPGNDQLYRITFTGETAAALGAMSVVNTGATDSIAYSLTGRGTALSQATSAVHLVDGFAAGTKGSFTLSFVYEGNTYTTAGIDLHASDASFTAAMLAATKTGGASFASVAGNNAVSVAFDTGLGKWRLTFAGNTAGKVIPQMTRSVTPTLAPNAGMSVLVSGATAGAGHYTTGNLDFHASAAQVKAAIEAASNGSNSFSSTGATVSVSVDSATHQWKVSFGGTAVGQNVSLMNCDLAATPAPDASLARSATGATTSEVQHLALASGTGLFALTFGNQRTAALDLSGLTSAQAAAALQAALEGLSGIGSGNVIVAASQSGGWDITFTGAKAGMNISAIAVQAVALFDLNLSGQLADALRVKLQSATDWGTVVSLAGMSTVQQTSALQHALEGLAGVGSGNVQVVAVSGQAGKFQAFVQGSLAGQNLPAIDLGLSAAVVQPPSYVLIGAHDVNAYVGTSTAGLSLTHVNVGLVLSQGAAAGQTGYALYASGTAALQGGGAVSLTAPAVIKINALGRAIDMAVKTGISTPDQQVSFADGIARKEVTITNGTVAVGSVVSLSGNLKVISTTVTNNGTTTTDLSIGLDSVTGNLDMGGVTGTLTNGQGGVLLHYETTGGTTTSKYAVEADGSVSVSAGNAVTLSATNLQIAYNQWGSDLTASVATASGSYALNMVKDETRLRGQVHADVAGVLTVDGQVYIESKKDQTVTLSGGGTVVVDQLFIGGAGVSASIGSGSTLTSLSDVNVGVVISTEKAGAQRRWLTSKATVNGDATIAGYARLQASAALDINRQLGTTDLALPVVNWGAAAPANALVAISSGHSITLDEQVNVFDLAITNGSVALGPATLGGNFDFSRDTAGNWTIVTSNAWVKLEASGTSVGVRNVSSTLHLNADGSRSGNIQGDAFVEGVTGLTLEGTLQVTFDADGNLQLAGDALVDVAGFAGVSGQFAITKNAAPTVVAPVLTVKADAGTAGTVTTSQQGAVKTNTLYRLDGMGGDGLRFAEGVYSFTFAGHTATVNSLTSDGLDFVADATFASRIQTAIAGLAGIGAGNVTVTGSRTDGFAIEFTGALAGKAVALTMAAPADMANNTDWGQVILLSQAQAGTVASQYLLIQPAARASTSSNSFSLTVGSVTTASIRYLGDPTAQAAQIKAALEALTGVGSGKVSVSFDQGSTLAAQGYTIRFASSVSLSGAMSVAVAAGTQVGYSLQALSASSSATGSVQLLDRWLGYLPGASYTLSFDFNGATFTTGDIPFRDTAEQVRNALLDATNPSGKTFSSLRGDVTVVSANAGAQWQISFGGAALGQAIPLMDCAVDVSSATGQLASVRTGATTSESQRISLAGTGEFALCFGGQTTSALASTATAAQVRSALESLSSIGVGNVAVSAHAGGGWDVSFQGSLAATNVASLQVAAVQMLNLAMSDGKLADALSLRYAGETAWSDTAILTGLSDSAVIAALTGKIESLAGIGAGNVRVTAVAGQAGQFQVVASGALAGQTLRTLVAGVSRDVEQPPSYLLIGATNVNAYVGNATAGVAVSNLNLGLVLSRDGAGQGGYALSATGHGALHGFGSDVTLSADAEIHINTLGRAVDITVPAGLKVNNVTPTHRVTYTDGTELQEVIITNGHVAIGTLVTLDGNLAIRSTTTTTGTGASRVSTTNLAIGLASVSGSLSLGGAVTAGLTDGNGAILLESETTGTGTSATTTSRYAVQADGNVSFNTTGAITLTADHLQIAVNRWGEDVSESVGTGLGRYDMDLLNGETRVRGHMTADVAGVLHAEGDLYLESLTGQSVTLTDAQHSRVTVNQLVLGGANISASVGSGELIAALSDVNLGVIISTEQVAQGQTARRWLSSKATVGSASIAGYQITGTDPDVPLAALEINRAIADSANVAAANNAPVVNWAGANRILQITSDAAVTINETTDILDVTVDGSLAIGPARMSGHFDFLKTTSGWTITANDVNLGFAVAGASFAIENASGQLNLGVDAQGHATRSGSVSGSVSLSGLDILSLSGTMDAQFDSNGNLQLGGNVDLSIAGLATLSGDFLIGKTVVAGREQIQVQAINVEAFIGVNGIGARLTHGSLALLAMKKADGSTGYAITGGGTVTTVGTGVNLTGLVGIRANTLGMAVNQSMTVGGQTLTRMALI